MTTMQKTSWRMTGDEVSACNCDYGCPCQFNALPTHGRCDGIFAAQIREGSFGALRLDGLRFAVLVWTPGALHEGNGVRQLVLDERASPEQRQALEAIEGGGQGGAIFEIFAAMLPNAKPTLVAPIEFECDRERRTALVRVPGIAEVRTEPIKNPVTGEPHRARIVLPEGFEFKEAEMASAVTLRSQSAAPLIFEYSGTYGQLNAFEWSNA